jgi:G3E family GTPase
LLTGYLGSGKTTLLAGWLRGKEIADSVLIINEIGEVGLDQHVLRGVGESCALLSNTCICCTGLPGLEQALADIFWARLRRKMEPFTSVIIETTGLADPAPIAALFNTDALLRERYRLVGIVTTLNATSGLQVLARHSEAVSQVRMANLVVITKIDLVAKVDVTAIEATVRELNSSTGLAISAQSSLSAQSMLALLAKNPIAAVSESMAASRDVLGSATSQNHPHQHQHDHAVRTQFFPLPEPLKPQAFSTQLDHWIEKHKDFLLRIKGLVQTNDGALVIVQWALGDAQADMALFSTSLNPSYIVQTGLTVIFDGDVGMGIKLPSFVY